ncbi:MAG: ABC transporter ATP-binding protein [Desulfobacterales bacterium]|jgi:ABC-type Fe3+/spermidine/putrescine transport system ATPase subunit
MALLEVIDINKDYEGIFFLDKINLRLEAGNILCLLGPSGCGKTSLLRIIAGLEKADNGKVTFDGRNLARIPPHRRGFGMMFQDFSLFPHKNVFDNVAFALKLKRQPRERITRRVEKMLRLVGLEGFERRDVNRLSGGESQRVALARSLASQPRMLMLDEPLGSLDRVLRERLMTDLYRIIKQVGVTTLYVTHDHAEAFTVADVVAVMNAGKVVQVDQPEALYRQPANELVARFLGFHNLVEGVVALEGGIETVFGMLYPAKMTPPPGTRVTVLLRPEGARLVDANHTADPGETIIRGMVTQRAFKGGHFNLTVRTDPGKVLSFDFLPDDLPPASGQSVRLLMRPSAMILIPGASQ